MVGALATSLHHALSQNGDGPRLTHAHAADARPPKTLLTTGPAEPGAPRASCSRHPFAAGNRDDPGVGTRRRPAWSNVALRPRSTLHSPWRRPCTYASTHLHAPARLRACAHRCANECPCTQAKAHAHAHPRARTCAHTRTRSTMHARGILLGVQRVRGVAHRAPEPQSRRKSTPEINASRRHANLSGRLAIASLHRPRVQACACASPSTTNNRTRSDNLADERHAASETRPRPPAPPWESTLRLIAICVKFRFEACT